MNILERVDIPINDYNTGKTDFKYSLDYHLSNLNKTDNINAFHHDGLQTKVTSVRSEHEPLFNSENMLDNNQQGDAIVTIMKSNLWVPAKKHPQIAPAEFTNWIKQYREEKHEQTKTKSKLRRKKSQLSSVSYPMTNSNDELLSLTEEEEQQQTITESKHRSNQKSLLRRRQLPHARKQGQRGLSISAEKPLIHEITNDIENQDRVVVNKQHQFVTHLNETKVPTQQESGYVIQQVPSPRLPITDTFSKTEIDKKMQGAHIKQKKKWSFIDLFKRTKNDQYKKDSKFQNFFSSKASPNKKNQLPPCRNTFSNILPIPERLPVYVERAIYHLSHVKLANTKRPLCQQVVISNMMYCYLNRNQLHCSAPDHYEPSHYPDLFEPPRHDMEEAFLQDTTMKNNEKKQKKKKKYKPVQNKQYTNSVVV